MRCDGEAPMEVRSRKDSMFRSLIALALGTFLLGMSEFSMEGILPDVSRDMAVSIPMAGHIISVYALGVCTGAVFLIILNRVSPKKLILAFVCMALLGSLLSVSAQSFSWLLASRFISGLPHGAYYGVGTIIASRLADEKHKTRAVAVMCAGMTFANLLGVPVSTLLSGTLSWRLPFVVIALVGVIALILDHRWIPDLDPLPTKGFRGQFSFLRHLAPWLIILATMFGNGGILAWYSYISPTLVELGGIDALWLPELMALAGGGMVAGNLLAGWISDRFLPGMTAAALQLIAAACLLMVFFFAEYGWLSIILMVITCTCLFGIGTPEQYLIIRHSPGGEMLGGCCIQIAFNFGNAMGAVLGGLPISAGLGYEWPAMVGFPAVLLGAALLFWFSRRYEKGRQQS